jgi:molecular chaperone GrpE
MKDKEPDVTPDVFETEAAADIVTEIPEVEVVVLDNPEQQGSFQDKYNETNDRLTRTLAEFDNFRKRSMREMASKYDDGIKAAITKLLPVNDNLERALAAQQDKKSSFAQGVLMIARQLDEAFYDLGAAQMDIEPGADFDPASMNAVAHAEDPAFGPNTVQEVLQKGYTYKNKVLRHAMVKVAN